MSETHDDANDARDLLGAWAIDAVDDRERALVERAIAADPGLAAEARELRDTVGMLGSADAEPPPTTLKDAVLAEVTSTPQAPQRDDATTRRQRTAGSRETAPRRGRMRWLAVAAAAVIAVGIPTGIAIDQANRADVAERQAEAMAEAMAQPGAELVAADLDDGGRAVAVLADGTALFTAHGTTDIGAHDQDYQLWVIHEDEAISAGVMEWDDGALEAQVDDFPAGAALAITAEPEGGSDQPTSDPLVILAAE